MVNPPFEVGKSYIFCTVTLYYIGQVAEMGIGWVRLEQASWIHWTGRLSTLLKGQKFTWRGGRTPRVEPCGEVILGTAPLVAVYPWHGDLPTQPIE